jgi:hypothetical protein
MDNATLDYALMAGEAYFYKRNELNRISVPQGASLLGGGLDGKQLASGFEARAYDYNGKIVISFAGTYFPDRFLSGLISGSVTNNDQAGLKDWVANVQLGAGGLDSQLRDAALYYQQIKTANPGKEVVFTGHSLGGGLAALMGVFFNKEVITFDPAPFRNTATEANAAKLKNYLATQGFSDVELNVFTSVQRPLAVTFPEVLAGLLAAAALGGPITIAAVTALSAYPVPINIRGENKIRAIAVAGEFLTGNDFNDFRNRLRILAGGVELVDQGSIGKIAGGDAHSISLLYLLGKSSNFLQLTKDNPNLLPLVFDRKLYGFSVDTRNPNFIETLLRKELGANGITQTSASTGLLDKFIADGNKLISTEGMSGQPAVQKALTVAAMEYYYFNEAASATALFTTEGNAIHFKYSDIPASFHKSKNLLVTSVQDFLSPSEQRVLGMSTDRREFANVGTGYLMQQDAWHIQSGTSGMTWSATGASNDAAIGGAQTDILDAGAGDDILLGGGGADFLTGGEGKDFLLGGQGSDTYTFDSNWGKDTVIDSDGSGSIQIDGTSLGQFQGAGGGYAFKLASGEYAGLAIREDKTSSSGYTAYITRGKDQDNVITLKNFDLNAAQNASGNGYLGIKLDPTQKLALIAGVAPVTTKSIALRAGISSPNLLKRFKNGAIRKQARLYAKSGSRLIDICAKRYEKRSNWDSRTTARAPARAGGVA